MDFYVDGSSNLPGSIFGIILNSFEDIQIEHNIHLKFFTSNNKVEYKPLIAEYKERWS